MRGEFDAVLAPYHDVGMTAIKVASFGEAVNVTLGLPFPRTSPDHGTAFDIAGSGTADATSMRRAVEMAGVLWNRVRGTEAVRGRCQCARMALRRAEYDAVRAVTGVSPKLLDARSSISESMAGGPLNRPGSCAHSRRAVGSRGQPRCSPSCSARPYLFSSILPKATPTAAAALPCGSGSIAYGSAIETGDLVRLLGDASVIDQVESRSICAAQ